MIFWNSEQWKFMPDQLFDIFWLRAVSTDSDVKKCKLILVKKSMNTVNLYSKKFQGF